MSFSNYIVSNQIVTMATVLSAFTYVYIGNITKTVLDPVFDYIFPDRKLRDFALDLPNGARIEVGVFLLETIRWAVYMLSFFYIFGKHI